MAASEELFTSLGLSPTNRKDKQRLRQNRRLSVLNVVE